ncbi:hypothetical protein BP5796_11021 [Coleophoma crateriformis]|uniref:CCHC-type domain-containing protein n=1 Tax=Coleophoma crateriformis TaxID=565419 RepID=A0A3D8QLQ1_9HELO|nr:hypothetical protein BP5796_11021 [Coleophoma crateriformis]
MSWDQAGGGTDSWNEPAAQASYEEGATGGYGDGSGDAGGNDGACFGCGETGHIRADCPTAPKRACFNCGEEGHSKADCPNPAVAREFSGNCRLCDKTGHRAAECPDAPVKVCHNCREEGMIGLANQASITDSVEQGHAALECKNPRKIDRSLIEDVPAEEAWKLLKQAAEDSDMDDVKAAAQQYLKALPDVTYVQLEKAFRGQNMGVFLIALQREIADVYTNMDLQGNLDKKYTVTWRSSSKPRRPKEHDGWPTLEENLVRLEDAGEPVERGIPKCTNCDNLGHTFKACPEEKQENADKAILSCVNCSEPGHRSRDCPVPRVDKFACRNCSQPGHSAKDFGHFSKDCPSGGGGAQTCFNCGQEGHRSSECTNEKVSKCRNCDEVGHISRECPKPRDYSRVKCSNCQQMGHTKVRCKEPLAEEKEDDGGYGENAAHDGNASGGDSSWANPPGTVDAGW